MISADQETGCVSVATQLKTIFLERLVEYFCPERESCTIWVDLFINNVSTTSGWIWLLHRGSLTATEVTAASWPASADSALAERGCAMSILLTRYLKKLHEIDAEIKADKRRVTVGNRIYDLASLSRDSVSPVIGKTEQDSESEQLAGDIPFTLWKIEDLPPGRSLLRVQLQMTKRCFRTQIGTSGRFYAYGEALLLRTIETQDLEFYEGPDRGDFRKAFAEFTGSHHLVPDVFEYIITSADPNTTWTTKALSQGFSKRYVPPELKEHVSWHSIEWPDNDGFHMQGDLDNSRQADRENDFAVYLQPA